MNARILGVKGSTDLPDAVRNTIDRYIGGGLTDDEDDE